MVDLVFRGPPLRSTTFKLNNIKELQREWWTWWTFFVTSAYVCAHARARARVRNPEGCIEVHHTHYAAVSRELVES